MAIANGLVLDIKGLSWDQAIIAIDYYKNGIIFDFKGVCLD